MQKKIGLKLKIHHKEGAGIGSSSMKVYKVGKTIFNFQNSISLPSNMSSMDLAHLIDALKSKGAKEIHGVIGNDILKKFGAIIDYSQKTLQFWSFVENEQ